MDAYAPWTLFASFVPILILVSGVMLLTHKKPEPSTMQRDGGIALDPIPGLSAILWRVAQANSLHQFSDNDFEVWFKKVQPLRMCLGAVQLIHLSQGSTWASKGIKAVFDQDPHAWRSFRASLQYVIRSKRTSPSGRSWITSCRVSQRKY